MSRPPRRPGPSDGSQGSFVVPPRGSRSAAGPNMPTIGIGAPNGPKDFDPSEVKSAILRAIELGYRHVQIDVTLSLEQPIREALAEALERGLVSSRDELFISCRIRYNSSDLSSIISHLKNSLENLKLDYVDLYLAEASGEDDPNLTLVWSTMESCQTQGFTNSIGVCNFTSNVLQNVLSFAKIPPSVNQVGIQHIWGNKDLLEFCVANKISVIASSAIGEKDDITQIVDFEVLKKLAKINQKSASQVLFRWAYEQGADLLLESFDEEHMAQITDIFEWELKEEE